MVQIVTNISENLQVIQKNIQAHSPHPEKVRILGVSKFQPLERVLEVIELGVTLLGVNYVQEGQKLRESINRSDVEWHFIGHIQSRKAKDLLDYALVQSLDRMDIAEDLNRRAQNLNKTLDVLIEVNIGREKQKAGIMAEDVDRFLKQLAAFPALSVKGLMTMPPPLSQEERRPFFNEMKKLYDRLSQAYSFEVLSMGTSEDYCPALEEGANLIRLGSCLFGARPLKTSLPN